VRYFRYYEPDNQENVVEVIMSDDEVKESYYPLWKEQMERKIERDGDDYVDIDSPLTFEICLNDWIATHWAEEINRTE
jgi:hypothetical protein